MRDWFCIFLAVFAVVASAFWIAQRPNPIIESPPLDTANAIDWLRHHNCNIEELADGGTRVEIPDLISPADAVQKLRSLPDIREI